MLETDAVTDAIVGFHCQQAVEKSLKAVLAASGADFPFTHDLGGLIELCEGAGTPVPATLEDADRLTRTAPGSGMADRTRPVSRRARRRPAGSW